MAEAATLTRDEIVDLVAEQVDLILRSRGGATFTRDDADRLDSMEAQLWGMMADRSLGRIINGPTWISGASVVDGTVTAPKISVENLEAIKATTGNLDVTGNITAAESYPAVGQRLVLNSEGLLAYNASNQQTVKIATDGSGWLGTGETQIVWDSLGTLNVPKAAISVLTIADIAGGTLGGVYKTSELSSRIELSTTGIVAYASGIETFRLNATTGAMTALGNFNIRSATTGARVEISNAGGISGYNSGGTETFRLNAATGEGFLGNSTSGISWATNGQVAIGGVFLQSGKITAQHLSVSELSAITANLGTVTAGSISANLIKTGTIEFRSGGTLSSGAVYTGTLDNLNLEDLTVRGTITLGSGGRIVDADGSFWDQSGIVLRTVGTNVDTIKFRNSSNQDIGSIYVAQNSFVIDAEHWLKSVLLKGAAITARTENGNASLTVGASPREVALMADFFTLTPSGISSTPGVYTTMPIYFGSGNLTNRPRIQATRWPSPNQNLGAFLDIILADDTPTPGAGYTQFRVFNGDGVQVWGIDSRGYMGLIDGTLSSTPGALAVKVPVSNRGTTRYLYLYDN